ncbi:alpha/beta hydrolase family protein [Pseudaquabacterium pictum]|uniref:Dienelactone hydrolase n=1 Tax=Pseudaquabacterium pictum TaxID=2315236 RepID=A0A480AQY1_9BURK|nr:dienelactone hydrolase [Rubrivivax pictus]GCL62105.1 dienelactone hydrolase [Rubrivivax pictus]
MTRLHHRFLTVLASLLVTVQVQAFEAGWTQVQTPGATPADARTTVALFYPTLAAPRTIPMGPFTLDVAIGARPVDQVKGLILLSHGIGGSELGHSAVAQALARHGYLVAAMRHPGDNWQEHTLIERTPERYFDERPRQASRVIDAILADPAWKDRIATDSQGPRVGALGHSAGGYTVLALAGGQPDLARLQQHCRAAAAQDPIFCSMGRADRALPPAPADAPPLADARVRAVVAMAPAGVVLTAASLAAVRPATLVYVAERDRFLVPRFHAGWVAANLPAPNLRPVPNAWHFAFMDTPGVPIPSPDGDIAADPPGFDRAGFLQQLGTEITAFFDRTLR